MHGKQLGNPKKGAEVIYEVLTQTNIAQGKEVPLVLALGSDAVSTIQKFARDQVDLVESWREVSSSTDYPQGKHLFGSLFFFWTGY